MLRELLRYARGFLADRAGASRGRGPQRGGQRDRRRRFLRAATFEHLEHRQLLTAVTISGGDNSKWSIHDDVTTTSGAPDSGFLTIGTAGSGASVRDAELGTQDDAFDGASMVWVNGTQVGGMLSQSGNRVTFGGQSIAGLNVQLQYDVLTTDAVLRNLVTLANPTASPITVPVVWASNFGSDNNTTIERTSYGDNTIFSTLDRWVITYEDVGSNPDAVNTTVLFGPGSPAVTPSTVSQTVFTSSGTQGVLAGYSVTVPAGQTRSLMFFHQLSSSRSDAVDDTELFDQPAHELLAGLTRPQVSQIVNWDYDLECVANPSFETGNFSPWQVVEASNQGTVAVSDNDASHGDYSGRLHANTAFLGGTERTDILRSPLFFVSPGNTVAFDWRISSRDGDPVVTAWLRDLNGNALVLDASIDTASWVVKAFTVPADTSGVAFLEFQGGVNPRAFGFNPEADLYVDHIRVIDAGGPYTIDEGSGLTLHAAGCNPFNETFSWDVNGDGTFDDATGRDPTLTWSQLRSLGIEDGPDTFSVRVRMLNGNQPPATSAPTTLTVKNVAPQPGTFTLTDPIDENGSATLSGSFTDPGPLDTHTVTINWGDGSAVETLVLPAGTTAFSSDSHQYLDNGSYTVSAKIADKDQATFTASTTLTVKNVKPSAVTLTVNPAAIAEGETTTLSGSFTDPGTKDTHVVTIAWGDGTSTTLPALSANVTTIPATAHQYLAGGDLTIQVTVTDKDGGSGTGSTSLVATNQPPADLVLAATPVAINEGSVVTLGGTFTNPNPVDSHTVWIHWGDGTPDTQVLMPTPASPTSVYGFTAPPHQYLDNPAAGATYTIGVTVTDRAGGSTTGEKEITVRNVAPALGGLLVTPSSIAENDIATLTGLFTDPGQRDAHTLAIDWSEANSVSTFALSRTNGLAVNQVFASSTDDARLTVTAVNATTGVVSFRVAHQYHDNGVAAGGGSPVDVITVTVSDEAGGRDTLSTSITVNNVAPTATLDNDGPIDEGGSVTVAFSDPFDPSRTDTAAGLHYSFAEKEADLAATYAAATDGTSKAFPFKDSDRYTVWGRLFDKDNGSTTYSTDVTVDNAPPTATLSNTGPIGEGRPVTVQFSDPVDPSPDDTEAGFHYSYSSDLSAAPLATTYDGALDGPSRPFTFPDNGTYTVAGRIFDKDGGYTEYSTVVTVLNVAPSDLHLQTTASAIDETGSVALSGTFTDPGTLDTHVVTIDWGDGTATDTLPLLVGETAFPRFPLVVTHQYADNPTNGNTYTIRVTVTDKDQGSTVGETTLRVYDLPAILSNVKMTSTSVLENDTAIVTGTFTDAGLWDVHLLAVNWGDPNTAAASTFKISRTQDLVAGQLFQSLTDGGTLQVEAVDTENAEVQFSVGHRYADDGLSGGNGTAFDDSPISVMMGDEATVASGALLADATGGPYHAFEYPYQSLSLVPGTPDVFTILNHGDDTSRAVDLGPNKFNFYGQTVTGATGLFASPNLLSTDAAMPPQFHNTDLSNAPSGRTIAVLWDDWVTSATVGGQVLGRFDGVHDDGTADRLIIEWHDVHGYGIDGYSPSGVTFQAVLELNTGSRPGDIVFNYMDVNSGDSRTNGATATVGIKNANSVAPAPLLVSYHTASPFVGDGKAILISARSQESLSVTVENVEPSLSQLAVTPVAENGVATLTGIVVDPGLHDAHSLTVNWGDGTSEPLTSTTVAVLDQRQLSAGAVAIVDAANTLTQEFTVDQPGQLTGLELSLKADNQPGPLLVEIVKNPAVTGAATVLAWFAVDPDDLGGFPGALSETAVTGTRIDLSAAGIAVTPGEKLAFRLSSPTSPGPRGYRVSLAGSGTHIGEAAFKVLVAQHKFSATHVYADDNPASLEGDYRIEVGVTDDDTGAGTGTVWAQVDNVAPRLAQVTVTPTVAENGTVTLTGTFVDQGLQDPHTVSVQWGDLNRPGLATFAVGATRELAINQVFVSATDGAQLRITAVDQATGAVSFQVTHQYADDGLAPGNGQSADLSPIRVTVADDDGGEGTTVNELLTGGATLGRGLWMWSQPFTVPRDANAASLRWSDSIWDDLHPVSDPDQVYRGSVLDASGQLLQELFSTHTGDSLRQAGPNHRAFDLTALLQSHAGESLQLRFEVADPYGSLTVTVADVHLVANQVLVTNVAPVLSGLTATSPLNENDIATLTGTFRDVGLLDGHTVVVDWGDSSTNVSTFKLPAVLDPTVEQPVSSTTDGAVLSVTAVNRTTGTVDFRVKHQYLEDAALPGDNPGLDSFTIHVTVSDDDSGEARGTVPVQVHNVAPANLQLTVKDVETLQPTTTVVENGRIVLSGTFTDPGTLDTHVVTIDWGDGTPTTTLPRLLEGVTTIPDTTHRYLNDPGNGTPYTIRVTVTDADGASTVGETALVVDNVTAVLSDMKVANVPVFENDEATVTGTFTDPGLWDVHRLTVNWGDPNNAAVSTFKISRTQDLVPGQVFPSLTDGGALTVTAVWANGVVDFSVGHRYADDGVIGGNDTPSDDSPISVTIGDDDTVMSGPLVAGPDGAGYHAFAYPYEAINLVPGTPGVFTILDNADDAFAAIDLGTNTFKFYNTTLTGANSLFASPNRLSTLNSAAAQFHNTDLTADPSQQTIAVLWDDWVTSQGASDQVLGKFEDVDGDGVADRLIIEWNDVHGYGSDGYSPSGVTFQAVLELNTGLRPGDIVFNYVDVGAGDSRTDGATATVGIKDAGPQDAADPEAHRLLVSYNTENPFIGDGEAILISARSQASLTVTVWNKAPSVSDLVVTQPLTENMVATLTGTVFDPGLRDAHTLQVNWGDGKGEPLTYATVAVLDQSQLDGAAASQIIDETRTVMQTFTVNQSGQLTALELSLKADNAPGPLIVEIVDPRTALVLGRFSVAARDLGGFPGTLSETAVTGTRIDLSSADIAVQRYDRLAFRLSSPKSPGPRGYRLSLSRSDPYQEGQFSVGSELFAKTDAAFKAVVAQYKFSVTHVYEDDHPTGTPVDVDSIRVRVTDDDTGWVEPLVPAQVDNVPPQLTAVTVTSTVAEDGTVTLAGKYVDRGLRDTHTVTVVWDDPNRPAKTETTIPSTATLKVNDRFTATDGTELLVTAVDQATGTVAFQVTHRYLDDGQAPGDEHPIDLSAITVTVNDDDQGVAVMAGKLLVNDTSSSSLGPGRWTLSQAFSVPYDFNSAVVSWSDRIGIDGTAAAAIDPDQVYRVRIVDGNGQVLQELCSTRTGDALPQTTARLHTFDVTSLLQPRAGETLELRFELQDPLGNLRVTVNNVSLGVANVVRVTNLAPVLSSLTVTPTVISEHEIAKLTGTFSDVGLLDGHTVMVAWDAWEENWDWENPGSVAVSTFKLPTVRDLVETTPYASRTDGAILTLTKVNRYTGTVGFSVEHQYRDDGKVPGNTTALDSVTIRVKVLDDDGDQAAGGVPLQVNNVAPALSNLAMTPSAVKEMESATLTGTVTDAGRRDGHTLKIDWGAPDEKTPSQFTLGSIATLAAWPPAPPPTFQSADGAALTVTRIDPDAGTFDFSVSPHRYRDDGPAGGNATAFDVIPVRVTVWDDDTGTASDTTPLTVSNVDPTIDSCSVFEGGGTPTTCGVPALFTPNTKVNLSATASDNKSLDQLTYTWTITQPDGTQLPPLPGKDNHFVPLQEGYYSVDLVVADDDLGQDTQSAPLLVATTLVELADSDLHLHVVDIMPGGKQDSLAVSFDQEAKELVITDPAHILVVTVPGASGHGTHTARVPLTAFAGHVQVEMLNGDDVVDVPSTTSAISIDAGEGADSITIGSTRAADNGNLDDIAAMVTVSGGTHPAGTEDSLYVNDRLKAAAVGYLITPTSITSQPGQSRDFAGIGYDGTLEVVRVDGSDQANVLTVQPSLTTRFEIDGNLPALPTVPRDGDFLELDTTGTAGRQQHVTGVGQGSWTFTSGHQPVVYESIEQFNHVGIVAVGADAGVKSSSRVRVYDAETNEFKFEFLAYEVKYRQGVRVATGDVNLDGIPDVITVPGRSRAPDIKVFDGVTSEEIITLRLAAKDTYGTRFVDGLNVAVGDVNGDGRPDIVTVPTRGPGVVKVFERATNGGTWATPRSFTAFADIRRFAGGASVAVGDLTGDGRDEIIVAAGSGTAAQTRVFSGSADGKSVKPLWKLSDPNSKFRAGLYVTVGDVYGDGTPDIITGAGPIGGSWVRVYDDGIASSTLLSFQAFVPASPKVTVKAAVRVLAQDIDDDGCAEVLTTQGPDARSNYQIRRYKVLDGRAVKVDDFFATSPDFSGGGLYIG